MFRMTEDSVIGATQPHKFEQVNELWQYEEERRQRRERRSRTSSRIVAVFVALALATLAYDSGHAAWALHKYRPLSGSRGHLHLPYTANLNGSWVYPAVISTISTLAALLVLAFAARRRRRAGSHRSHI
jgi:lipopolysaccharide export LptBFGC system permease protein LptF